MSMVVAFKLAAAPAVLGTLFGIGRAAFSTEYIHVQVDPNRKVFVHNRVHAAGAGITMPTTVPLDELCLLTVRVVEQTGGDAGEMRYEVRLNAGGPDNSISYGSVDDVMGLFDIASFAERPGSGSLDHLSCEISRAYIFDRAFSDAEHDALYDGGAITTMGEVLRVSGNESPAVAWKLSATTGNVTAGLQELKAEWPHGGADYDIETVSGSPVWSDAGDTTLNAIVADPGDAPYSNRLNLVAPMLVDGTNRNLLIVGDSVSHQGRSLGDKACTTYGIRTELAVGVWSMIEVQLAPVSGSPTDTDRMEVSGVSGRWDPLPGTEEDTAPAGTAMGTGEPWVNPTIGASFIATTSGRAYATTGDITSPNSIFQSILTGDSATPNKTDGAWWKDDWLQASFTVYGGDDSVAMAYGGHDSIEAVNWREMRWDGVSVSFADIAGTDYDLSTPTDPARFETRAAITALQPLYVMTSPHWNPSASLEGAGVALVSTGSRVEPAGEYLAIMSGVLRRVDASGDRVPGFGVGTVAYGGLTVYDHIISSPADVRRNGYRSDEAIMAHLLMHEMPQWVMIYLGYNSEPEDLISEYASPTFKAYLDALIQRYRDLYAAMGEASGPTFILVPPVPHNSQLFVDRRCPSMAKVCHELSVENADVASWNGQRRMVDEAVSLGHAGDVVEGYMVTERAYLIAGDKTHMTRAGHARHIRFLNEDLAALSSSAAEPVARAMLVHTGKTTKYTPLVDVAAGEVIVQGQLVGVTKRKIKTNEAGTLSHAGIFGFPKEAGAPYGIGTPMYWNSTLKVAIDTSDGGANKRLGVCAIFSFSGDTKVAVRLMQ